MLSDERNIYKTARTAAGLTQEAAAEKLGISDTSIRAYENGLRLPPVEVVDLMVIAYNSQLLGIQHLRASADMARRIVPDVQEMPLPEAIMSLLDCVYAFVDERRDKALLKIGKDGIIDEHERPVFDDITEELNAIVKAAMAVRYARRE